MYSKRYKSNTLRGKLRVCRYLSADKSTSGMVPYTVKFTESNLKRMTEKYSTLYMKPDIGSLGIGVYKLNRTSNGFQLHRISGKKQISKTFKTLSGLFHHVKSLEKNKRMIIQKAIRLDRVEGRPYDIRMMIQRKPGGAWRCTGFMVKVGSRHKIVTNYYQGGKIYTIHKLLKKKGFSKESSAARIESLTRKGITVANVLSRKRSGMREMGIDFAYDGDNALWILEVNSNHPQFHPIKKLDRESYNRMMEYARSYGRYNAK
ncbi:YheC/YheD family protein [Paenibacillus spongiae]|uniref:YheC/YheD family protein n=1 Tax=Paenibacillus spongiae TaxID=2909671 RepID=A0ABY5S846_9BACL|nr:YheC/YheD family protein [Paenibacillus spongiae]UVI30097.1 YheC/YheD family protein [Paenibacillus spongiae]